MLYLIYRADTPDLVLTQDLQSAHVVDFNPYAARMDPPLFTHKELNDLHQTPSSPILKTIDSASHASAACGSPANVHNMVPFEMLSMSSGQTIDSFAKEWQQEIQQAMKDEK